MLFYHFVGNTLYDGRPIPADNEWLEHTGELIMCKSGLHASLTPFEALQYAPGVILCLVELNGEILKSIDKVVAARRKIIQRVDLTETLRLFARQCALDVIHLWEAPQIVKDYLRTGDETIRYAVQLIVQNATWIAAHHSINAAARYATRSAAQDDAWYAANAAARYAAQAAIQNDSNAAVQQFTAQYIALDTELWSSARNVQAERFNSMSIAALE